MVCPASFLPPEKRPLKEQLADLVTDSYGFIIRTNAQQASEERDPQEAAALAASYEKIRKIAGSRTCFSCLYRPAGRSSKASRAPVFPA